MVKINFVLIFSFVFQLTTKNSFSYEPNPVEGIGTLVNTNFILWTDEVMLDKKISSIATLIHPSWIICCAVGALEKSDKSRPMMYYLPSGESRVITEVIPITDKTRVKNPTRVYLLRLNFPIDNIKKIFLKELNTSINQDCMIIGNLAKLSVDNIENLDTSIINLDDQLLSRLLTYEPYHIIVSRFIACKLIDKDLQDKLKSSVYFKPSIEKYKTSFGKYRLDVTDLYKNLYDLEILNALKIIEVNESNLQEYKESELVHMGTWHYDCQFIKHSDLIKKKLSHNRKSLKKMSEKEKQKNIHRIAAIENYNLGAQNTLSLGEQLYEMITGASLVQKEEKGWSLVGFHLGFRTFDLGCVQLNSLNSLILFWQSGMFTTPTIKKIKDILSEWEKEQKTLTEKDKPIINLTNNYNPSVQEIKPKKHKFKVKKTPIELVDEEEPFVEEAISVVEQVSKPKKMLAHFVSIFTKNKEDNIYQETCQLTVKTDLETLFFADNVTFSAYLTFGLPKYNSIMGSHVVRGNVKTELCDDKRLMRFIPEDKAWESYVFEIIKEGIGYVLKEVSSSERLEKEKRESISLSYIPKKKNFSEMLKANSFCEKSISKVVPEIKNGDKIYKLVSNFDRVENLVGDWCLVNTVVPGDFPIIKDACDDLLLRIQSPGLAFWSNVKYDLVQKVRYDLDDLKLSRPYSILSMETEGSKPCTLHIYENNEGELLLSTCAIYVNIQNTNKYAFYRPQEIYKIER